MESVQSLRALFMHGDMSLIARAHGGFVIFGFPDQAVGVILTDKDDVDLLPSLWAWGFVAYESHIWDESGWISVIF